MSRKSARDRESAAAPTPTPVTGELVKIVHVGRLETVADWRRQISKIFREMRKRELAHEDGTRLTYVANVGAQLAKVEQELKELQQLREQLARIEAGAPAYSGLSGMLPALDVLPASTEGVP